MWRATDAPSRFGTLKHVNRVQNMWKHPYGTTGIYEAAREKIPVSTNTEGLDTVFYAVSVEFNTGQCRRAESKVAIHI